MPIVDILTGGGTTTNNSGGSSNSSTFLSGLASTMFPGLGGILSNIINTLNPACWGGQAIPKTMVEDKKKHVEQMANKVSNDPYNYHEVGIVFLTCAIESHSFLWQSNNTLSNACSKANAKSISTLYKNLYDTLLPFYNGYMTDSVYTQGSAGNMTVNRFQPTQYLPPVIPTTPTPTNPTSTPTNTGGGTTPTNPTSTPTNTGGGTPTGTYTNGDGTTSTVTNTGGLVRTITTNLDGSKTYSDYNPASGNTTVRTIPASTASSLNGGIDISGQVGDWTFGASNNQNQTMYLIGGAVGLGALLLILNKKK